MGLFNWMFGCKERDHHIKTVEFGIKEIDKPTKDNAVLIRYKDDEHIEEPISEGDVLQVDDKDALRIEDVDAGKRITINKRVHKIVFKVLNDEEPIKNLMTGDTLELNCTATY